MRRMFGFDGCACGGASNEMHASARAIALATNFRLKAEATGFIFLSTALLQPLVTSALTIIRVVSAFRRKNLLRQRIGTHLEMQNLAGRPLPRLHMERSASA